MLKSNYIFINIESLLRRKVMTSKLKKILAFLFIAIIIVSTVYIIENKENYKEDSNIETNINITDQEENELLLSSLDRDDENSNNIEANKQNNNKLSNECILISDNNWHQASYTSR